MYSNALRWCDDSMMRLYFPPAAQMLPGMLCSTARDDFFFASPMIALTFSSARQLDKQMRVNLRHRDRQQAITPSLKVPHDFASDDRAITTIDMDLVATTNFLKFVQFRVFARRRRISVITRGMNAVFAAAKAAWISVEPGSTRVDDDVAPKPSRPRHGCNSPSPTCDTQDEALPDPGRRDYACYAAPAWTERAPTFESSIREDRKRHLRPRMTHVDPTAPLLSTPGRGVLATPRISERSYDGIDRLLP